MSQLTDYLQQTGLDTVAEVLRTAGPEWRVFNLLWSDPQELPAVCAGMGWQTVDDVNTWVQRVNEAIGNTQAFEELIDPAVPYTTTGMKKTPWHPLHVAIHATGTLASDCFLHNSDLEYFLPTKAQWEVIAALCPSKKLKHVGEPHDCDDFARHALGWLAAKGLGNCASAFAGTRHYMNQFLLGGHALVLVWDDTLTPWQWEPQSGRLFPATAPSTGPFPLATRVEYARIFA